MGLNFLFSSCSDKHYKEELTPRSPLGPIYAPYIREAVLAGNPDPTNFQILRCEKIGRFTLVLVEYPDCSNYEGKKILVFKDASKKKVKNLKRIDPHFCNSSKHPSPVARFKPTTAGWKYAVLFCKNA